jgi:hypothetical protein
MLPGDQRMVNWTQRLEWPMKWHVVIYGTSCTTTPISVTWSKWYIRKVPFFLGAQTLDMNLLSCC